MVALLARNASAWAAPAIYGLSASALLAVSILAIKTIGRLPAKRPVIDLDNVEGEVRRWLDNFRTGVQNSPIAEAHFRFIVTMDGGAKLLVGRPRDFSGYLLVRGEVIPSLDDQKVIAGLPTEAVEDIVSEIKLEMARAKVGYSGLALPITTIAILKRIPISEALTEDAFINKLEEVEAALNALGIISATGFRHNKHNTMLSSKGLLAPTA